MKAPDKIYLGIQDVGSGYVYDLSLNNNEEQEYIRKDALIEILQGYSHPLTKLVMQEIIDKINSL